MKTGKRSLMGGASEPEGPKRAPKRANISKISFLTLPILGSFSTLVHVFSTAFLKHVLDLGFKSLQAHFDSILEAFCGC